MTSFTITLYGHCCRLHVVGHRFISDISVACYCWSICSLCALLNLTSLPKVIWEEGHVSALTDTYAVKSPLVTTAHPKFASKSTPSRGPIPKPHYLPHPWTVRPIMPNGIRVQSAIFHNALDRPTDAQTDRSFTGKSDDYRLLWYESDTA